MPIPTSSSSPICEGDSSLWFASPNTSHIVMHVLKLFYREIFLCLLLVYKLLLVWAHWDMRVIFRLYIERNNTLVVAKRGVGPLCMHLDRSSFSGAFLSHSESWPVEQPPVVAYIHLDPSLPRKPHYPPCSLPGSVCWSVNTTSSTPCCLWELSPWEESGEEESRGRRRRSLSFFLSRSLLKRKLDVGALHSGVRSESNPFDHFKSWSSTWNSSSNRNKRAVDSPKASPLIFEGTHSQQTLCLVLFVEHGTPKLSLHDAALSP